MACRQRKEIKGNKNWTQEPTVVDFLAIAPQPARISNEQFERTPFTGKYRISIPAPTFILKVVRGSNSLSFGRSIRPGYTDRSGIATPNRLDQSYI
jgi:hypothetical protein